MSPPRAISQWLQHQLPEWERAGWITPEGAKALRDKYPPEAVRSGSLFFTAVSILGAALLGGGVILLFAYNWNELGRGIRTVLSLLPLLVAQGTAAYALLFKSSSTAWREGSATGIIASIAAGIGLIGQTYNIQGDVGAFCLTWMLLSAPLVLALRSTVAAFAILLQFLSWLLSTRFLVESLPMAWLLFAGVLACTVWLQWQDQRDRPFLNLLSSAVATVLLLVMGNMDLWYGWLLMLVGWWALLAAAGEWSGRFRTGSVLMVVGRIGLLALFLIASFGAFWEYPRSGYILDSLKLDLIPLVVVFLAIAWMLVSRWGHVGYTGKVVLISPFLAFAGWFLSVYGYGPAVAVSLNFVIVGVAVGLIYLSWGSEAGGGVRIGISLISIILILRFFDYEFSLLTRGIAFIIVGAAFLGTNLWLSRRARKAAS